jgi:hypothetical protein
MHHAKVKNGGVEMKLHVFYISALGENGQLHAAAVLPTEKDTDTH